MVEIETPAAPSSFSLPGVPSLLSCRTASAHPWGRKPDRVSLSLDSPVALLHLFLHPIFHDELVPAPV